MSKRQHHPKSTSQKAPIRPEVCEQQLTRDQDQHQKQYLAGLSINGAGHSQSQGPVSIHAYIASSTALMRSTATWGKIPRTRGLNASIWRRGNADLQHLHKVANQLAADRTARARPTENPLSDTEQKRWHASKSDAFKVEYEFLLENAYHLISGFLEQQNELYQKERARRVQAENALVNMSMRNNLQELLDKPSLAARIIMPRGNEPVAVASSDDSARHHRGIDESEVGALGNERERASVHEDGDDEDVTPRKASERPDGIIPCLFPELSPVTAYTDDAPEVPRQELTSSIQEASIPDAKRRRIG